MNLNLKRPLAFFDLETTGLDISADRIIEIAIHKVMPNGNEDKLVLRINPEMNIPADSTAIHGITDYDVKDAPTFKEEAQNIITFIGNADLAGYNSNRFDVPFLLEELYRNDFELDMSDRKSIDVQTIFHKMEQRTLEAALKFYCKKELKNAHNAHADAFATYEVLKGQLEMYENLENDVDALEAFTHQGQNRKIDFVGRLALNDKGEMIYNFGKNSGKTIAQVLKSEPGYHKWIIDNNFPTYTKKVLEKEVNRIKSTNNQGGSIENKLDALKKKFNN
ncbi:MAG: 3'-5' exonuclease [Crocinitomicaceae bacterium]|nr:3'-5' exonuclease [Crocinitomicaceae bacterium]